MIAKILGRIILFIVVPPVILFACLTGNRKRLIEWSRRKEREWNKREPTW